MDVKTDKPISKKKINGTLLVLGNGFDLNCGLPSTFKDFFILKLQNAKGAANTFTNTKCENIWYLLLYFAFYDETLYDYESKKAIELIYDFDPLWMDVESFIKKIITIDKKDDKWMSDHFLAQHNNYPEFLTYLYNSRFNKYIINDKNQKDSIRKHFRNLNVSDFNIYTYLYDELLKFEKDFKKYIDDCIKESPSYKNKCKKIFSELVDFANEPTSVISFNYTNSMEWYINPSEPAFKMNYYNIHGSLEEGIVIGFDSGDIKDNANLGIKMSKAWQKMNFTDKIYQLPKKNTITTLKFYGHSLGPQDYSYFHSLFDFYNIYNSEIRLVFCYTEYKKTEEDNARIRGTFVSAVYKLLTDYARKSGNEDKVTTIISRLQLENRLQIKQIPCFSKENQESLEKSASEH